MNEIDFKKLLRQERQIARSRSRNQKHQVSGPDSTEAAMNVADDVVNKHETVAAHEPYETLLANQLSERHQIHPPHSKIDSVYYTKQFLHEETCNEILDWLQTLPEYSRQIKLSEQEESKECCGKWTTLKHARRKGKVNEMRKVLYLIIDPCHLLTQSVCAVALFDASIAPLPPILSKLAATLKHTNAFQETPNHILINEYQKGTGIMSHTDGPAYNSRTATISIGGDVLFKFTKRRGGYKRPHEENECDESGRVMEILLHGCGSLIVFANDAYLNHCHGIDETLEETTGKATVNEKEGVLLKRDDRVSLTFRCKK